MTFGDVPWRYVAELLYNSNTLQRNTTKYTFLLNLLRNNYNNVCIIVYERLCVFLFLQLQKIK